MTGAVSAPVVVLGPRFRGLSRVAVWPGLWDSLADRRLACYHSRYHTSGLAVTPAVDRRVAGVRAPRARWRRGRGRQTGASRPARLCRDGRWPSWPADEYHVQATGDQEARKRVAEAVEGQPAGRVQLGGLDRLAEGVPVEAAQPFTCVRRGAPRRYLRIGPGVPITGPEP
jgi:hypothetical protein